MTIPGLCLRKMEATDLDAVVEIAISLPHAPQWPRSAYLAAIRGDGLPVRVSLVAAGLDGKIAGFILGTVLAPEAELESIGVAAGSQKLGIGAELLDAWRATVHSAGAERIVLEVRESNREARRLYARAGFVQAGLRRGYYGDPLEDGVLLSFDFGS